MNLTIRRLYAVTIIAAGLLILTACGVNTAPQTYPGVWTSADFSATVTETGIEIVMTSDDARALYWAGSFDGSSKPKDGTTIQSVGDVELMSDSLLGSQDPAKDFTYKDESLNFHMSMFGVDRDIHLVKQ